MTEHTLLSKLAAVFAEENPDVDQSVRDAIAAFIAWSEQWLVKNQPVGTGFAEGTSAITLRFQNGDQYPVTAASDGVSPTFGVQITGQADKNGMPKSNAFQITGK